MKNYEITYYYLATGMEGQADTSYYGNVLAESKEEAIDKAARLHHPDMNERDISWVKGCLTAHETI